MWLTLSLLTAVLAATQDIMAKRLSGRVSPYLIAWAWVMFSLPFLGVALFFERGTVFGPNFLPALLMDALTLTFSSICLFKAIQAGDLSQTMPLLSLTPIFLLVTSPIMVGEVPSGSGFAGIFLIVGGSYFLYYRWGEDGPLDPFRRMIKAKSMRYMLMVTLIFSIGANFDKIGTVASAPVAWSFALNALTAIFLGAALVRRVPEAEAQLKANWRWLLLLGFAMAIMMIVQMNAIVMSKVPYVITVKRVSILLSSIWGIWYLKEQGGLQRIVAALVMLAGVAVMSFAH